MNEPPESKQIESQPITSNITTATMTMTNASIITHHHQVTTPLRWRKQMSPNIFMSSGGQGSKVTTTNSASSSLPNEGIRRTCSVQSDANHNQERGPSGASDFKSSSPELYCSSSIDEKSNAMHQNVTRIADRQRSPLKYLSMPNSPLAMTTNTAASTSTTTTMTGSTKQRRYRLTKRRQLPGRSNSVPWKQEMIEQQKSDDEADHSGSSPQTIESPPPPTAISTPPQHRTTRFTYGPTETSFFQRRLNQTINFLNRQNSTCCDPDSLGGQWANVQSDNNLLPTSAPPTGTNQHQTPLSSSALTASAIRSNKFLQFAHHKSNSLPSNEPSQTTNNRMGVARNDNNLQQQYGSMWKTLSTDDYNKISTTNSFSDPSIGRMLFDSESEHHSIDGNHTAQTTTDKTIPSIVIIEEEQYAFFGDTR